MNLDLGKQHRLYKAETLAIMNARLKQEEIRRNELSVKELMYVQLPFVTNARLKIVRCDC